MNIYQTPVKPGKEKLTWLNCGTRICRECVFYGPVDRKYGYCGLYNICNDWKAIQQMAVHGDGTGCYRHGSHYIKYTDEI